MAQKAVGTEMGEGFPNEGATPAGAVFLSYASEDVAPAERLATSIAAQDEPTGVTAYRKSRRGLMTSGLRLLSRPGHQTTKVSGCLVKLPLKGLVER